jgi:class 3 adenylate cyclase
MEENMAILMADLSGYTALTETHGPHSAADVIDRYLGIVHNCLVGDSKLNERTGDEVMIISSSADNVLASALLLMKLVAAEENFLQVHGGLHYGKVLWRRNSLFGAAINLTARIAAKAGAGTFWCSDDFARALSGKCLANLHSQGKHSLKNVSEEHEMYEIGIEDRGSFYIDPVCRMLILNTTNAIKHPASAEIFFCSPACMDIYHKKSTN